MAGTVVHLVIADKLLDSLNIKNPALFFCGNLAPDAIMARKNYVREMKNHTHFKDGQKPYTFRFKENQEAYHNRFNAFVRERLVPERADYELYLGYVVHMLVDELFLMDYYEEILVEIEKKGIEPFDEKFSADFVSDVDQVDWELARNYKFKYPMPDILLTESDYEISGLITNEELLESKDFIIKRNFLTPHEKVDMKVSTLERNMEFIDLCVARIPEILEVFVK